MEQYKNIHNQLIEIINSIDNESYCNNHFIAFINDLFATICEYIENENYIEENERKHL